MPVSSETEIFIELLMHIEILLNETLNHFELLRIHFVLFDLMKIQV